eukprot:m.203061 g.203061  ORF g.203061 m.203061 type:complete len:243 (+) comp14986_c0_seq7:1398-2126(+)
MNLLLCDVLTCHCSAECVQPIVTELKECIGPQTTPFAVKHYNRLFQVVEWLVENGSLQIQGMCPIQLDKLTQELNEVADPYSTNVAWGPPTASITSKFLGKFKQWSQWESTSWSFSGKGLQGADAVMVADALTVNGSVQQLQLDQNSIGDEGAKALAASLQVNHTLQTLSVYANKIGPEGAKAFADSLKVNCGLTSLTLYQNTIGDEGAIALGEMLKLNSSIRELSNITMTVAILHLGRNRS